GIRPLVMRLYDHEDSVFNRYEVSEGECVLVIATAGEEEVAQAEAKVVERLTAGAKDLGEDPWRRWQEHRFGLSAEWLKEVLKPAGSYVDTIELAAPWTVLTQLHERVKTAIAVGGLALCHFSHAYEQGCCAYFSFAGAAGSGEHAHAAQDRARLGGDRIVAALDTAQVRGRLHDPADGGDRPREERCASVAPRRGRGRRRRHAQRRRQRLLPQRRAHPDHLAHGHGAAGHRR